MVTIGEGLRWTDEIGEGDNKAQNLNHISISHGVRVEHRDLFNSSVISFYIDSNYITWGENLTM